jgi:glucose-1-phosphate thymidylyltransferase
LALILGDTIFYGHDLPSMLHSASSVHSGATVMAYRVSDPSRYGVVEFAKHLRPSRRGELEITDINRM